MGNITQVHFKDGQECCYNITGLEQWDKGQKLEISGLDVDEYVEVHFSLQQYCGTAKRMLGKVEDGIIRADIPALILEGPECLYSDTGVYYAYAWLYVSDEESAETIRKMEFVIKARPKPEEYVTPEDLDFLEQLEAEMKNKLDKSGHAPNKILGTDAEGNVITKDEGTGATGEDQLLRFAIKPTTEKASFHNIQDSAEYKVLDIGMEGKTEQKSTSGKNLYSGGDIECTKTCEKTVSIKAGTYTFSADVISSDVTNIMIQTVPWAGENIYIGVGNGKRTSVTATYTNDISLIRFLLNDGESVKIKNLQIETGSTATPYEPYTGGQPSPNPEYPQEIVNAGEIYNLLNPGELENGLLLDENGSISTAGTYGDVYRIFKQTLPAGTYTLFINGAKISITRMILDGNFNVLNTTASSSYTFTVAKKSEVTICFRKEDSSAFDGTEEIQLNAGSVSKPYKPYTGRYEIAYNVLNANWFDGELELGSIHVETGLNTENAKFIRSVNFIPVIASQTYVITHNGDTKSSVNVRQYDKNKSYIGGISLKLDGIITVSDSCAYIRFNINETDITEVMINMGTIALPYVQNQSQPFTLISPVPLTKWDKLVKRDGKWYWEYRQLHFSVDGNSGWNMYTQFRGFLAKALPEVMSRRSGYCNQLIVDDNPSGSSSENGCWLGVSGKFLYVLKSDYYDDNLEDYGLANWKAHLNENPLEIWTYSDKSELVPLMPEEQTLLNNLETYYGVTNIYNDQGCPMWLTYVADTKLYVDNKILSIQTAMI